MRNAALATLALLTLASSALGDETYPVSGRHGEEPYQGSVVLGPVEGDELQVTHLVGTTTLTGRGRRDGLFVRAEVQQTVGVSEALANLGSTVEAGPPLQLTFQTNDAATRWRVRVEGPQGLVITGQGAAAPLPETTGAARQWVEFHGVPFVKAPEDDVDVHMNDPRQGQLGDCYFIAGMIAMARTRPDAIRSMIADQGDGSYEVTLRGARSFLYFLPADVQVELDQRYPASSIGRPVYAKLADEERVDGQVRYELWPMMLERAYAQHRGGYPAMENGWPGTVFALAGAKVSAHWAEHMTDDQLRAVLDRALEEGKPVSLGFGRKDLGETGNATHVVAHHAYVVTGSRDGGYVLYNPWGSSHPPRPITPAELRAMGPKIEVGDL